VQQFLIQDSSNSDKDLYFSGTQSLEDQQAIVLPSVDYNIVSDEDGEIGQVSLDVNITSLSRNSSQIINGLDNDARTLVGNPIDTAANERFHGIKGQYTRLSANLEWKNSTVTDAGALVTASLGVRGDGIFVDSEHLNTEVNPLTSNESIFRAMPTGALEIRYPLEASDGMASHIFEPIAQLVARPDETHIGRLPNEDAQSMVFDASNLFDFDKFSGYDRVEGGTRANLGFRYSASFEHGGSFDVVAGQSFHLAGKNSYAQRDLVNAGMESGLETARSDYVASMQYDTGGGIIVGASGRFDEKTLDIRRAEIGSQIVSPVGSLNASYIFTDEQPNYAFARERREINASGSLKVAEHWRVFGNASYDLKNGSMVSDGIGLAYDDECYWQLWIFLQAATDRESVVDHILARPMVQTACIQFRQQQMKYKTDMQMHLRTFVACVLILVTASGCTTSSTTALKSAKDQESKQAQLQNNGGGEGVPATEQQNADKQELAKVIRKPGTVSKKGTHIRVLVNNSPITNYDISKRAAFLKLRRIGGNRTKKAEAEMIEQSLKLQEARKRNTIASQKEVNAAFARFAKSNRATPTQMARELGKFGVGIKHFKGFIRTQMSWQRTVAGKFRADTQQVSQQDAIFELKKSGSAKPETTEYTIKQIVFVVPADRRKKILNARRKEANGFRQRFTSCDKAVELAKELRDVAVIDRGRVLEPELPDNWRELVLSTEPGKTTRPLVTPKGVELMAVCSKKTVSDDRTAQLLSQSKEYKSFNKKGNVVSDDYLKELRKNAVIIYR